MNATAFAPGRVELLGNHTDYNQGFVLSAAIQFGVTVEGATRDDGRIALASEGIAETANVPGVKGLAATHAWTDYPLGVVSVLEKEGCGIGGFEGRFSSDLPQGAGLSSSAALEVATAMLLDELFGLHLDPLRMAVLCRKAENDFVGVKCGLLDQVSSVFGQSDHAVHLDCRTETVARIPVPSCADLLVIHSGVRHALTGGEYNERRDQCFEAARLLGARALRDVSSAQLAAADLPDLLRRRAAHIVGENERVELGVELLKSGDIAGFGKLLGESHHSSTHNFGNSTPELDALVDIALETPGVYGGRLTGGGFGGATVNLVKSESIDEIAERIVSEYARKTGNQAAAYRCHFGDGARVLKKAYLS